MEYTTHRFRVWVLGKEVAGNRSAFLWRMCICRLSSLI